MAIVKKKEPAQKLTPKFIGAAQVYGKYFGNLNLSGSLASTARCYVAVYQDRPIAFIAVVHIHMKAIYYRVTRLVVWPDYQGIGVGKRLLNFIAEMYTSQTKIPFYILTINPDHTWKHG